MSELRLVVCGKLGESRSRMGRIGEGGEQAQVWPEGGFEYTWVYTLTICCTESERRIGFTFTLVQYSVLHIVISQLKLPMKLTLSFVRPSALNNLWKNYSGTIFI